LSGDGVMVCEASPGGRFNKILGSYLQVLGSALRTKQKNFPVDPGLTLESPGYTRTAESSVAKPSAAPLTRFAVLKQTAQDRYGLGPKMAGAMARLPRLQVGLIRLGLGLF